MTYFNLTRTKSFIRFCGNISSYFLIHLFHQKRLGTLKHQAVFMFVFFLVFLKENKQTQLVLLFVFGQKVVFFHLLDIYIYQFFQIIILIFLLLLCQYCFSIDMISFYILSKGFFLKREGLPDARVGLITKIICLCNTFFYKDS